MTNLLETFSVLNFNQCKKTEKLGPTLQGLNGKGHRESKAVS